MFEESYSVLETGFSEITVLGTGGGYGESIVIGLDSENWIIVDSCKKPNSSKVLPLEYLKSQKIDVSTKVKRVICTHWHGDHITGLSTVLEQCHSAEFVISCAYSQRQFSRLLKLKSKQKLNRSSREFEKCIDITSERGKVPITASIDKTIYSTREKGNALAIEHEVISLSPTASTENDSREKLKELFKENEGSTELPYIDPNETSILLFLKLKGHRAMLGADLEVVNNAERGWQGVIKNQNRIDELSSYFKISHHGSENGYFEPVWDFFSDSPISTITPWNKKNKLPSEEMINKYLTKTEELYITSTHVKLKKKDRDSQVNKRIKKFGHAPKMIPFDFGMIRSRIKHIETHSVWDVEVFGSSLKVSN